MSFISQFIDAILIQANILVDKSGVACLSDFGLSQTKLQSATYGLPKNGSVAAQSTLRYMSPEQLSQGAMNKQTDVYSFGMTAYEVDF